MRWSQHIMGLISAILMGCGHLPAATATSSSSPMDLGSDLTRESPSWERLLQTSIVVPPDHAVQPISVSAEGDTFEQAAAELRGRLAQIESDAGKACAVQAVAYDAPRHFSKWHAGGQLLALVDLRGANDVRSRMERIDACLGKLKLESRVGHKLSAPVSGAALYVRVDDPQQHRNRLLKNLQDRLAAVAKLDAPQWAAADLRCTSTGVVNVTERLLSGVRLELDVRCDVVRGLSDAADRDRGLAARQGAPR